MRRSESRTAEPPDFVRASSNFLQELIEEDAVEDVVANDDDDDDDDDDGDDAAEDERDVVERTMRYLARITA